MPCTGTCGGGGQPALSCEHCFNFRVFSLLFASAVGGRGFDFCVFVVGWRRVLFGVCDLPPLYLYPPSHSPSTTDPGPGPLPPGPMPQPQSPGPMDPWTRAPSSQCHGPLSPYPSSSESCPRHHRCTPGQPRGRTRGSPAGIGTRTEGPASLQG